MTIRVKSREANLAIWLPTWLIFSKGFLKLGLKIAEKHAQTELPPIPPGAIDAICAEVRRIKGKHSRWELVDVESADGDHVKIVL